MSVFKRLTVLAAIGSFSAISAQTVLVTKQAGPLGPVEITPAATYSVQQGKGVHLNLQGYLEGFAVRVPSGADWRAATHVLVTVRNISGSQANVRFGVESGPSWSNWMESDVALPAGRQVKLAVPLFDPRGIGLEVFPSLGIDGVYQTTSYGTIRPADVRFFRVYNRERVGIKLTLVDVRAVKYQIPAAAFVDEYGQQDQVTWQDKVQSDGQLVEFDSLQGNFPYSADDFGGLVGGANYEKRPRFTLGQDGGRFFFVTPDGNPFFSSGVNEVGAVAFTQVEKREKLFKKLPPRNGPLGDHYSQWRLPSGNVLSFNYYSANLERKYGADWKSQAFSDFLLRLKSWGFNTVGAGSDPAMYSAGRLPFTRRVDIEGAHQRIYMINGAQHDVFDSSFLTSARNSLRQPVKEMNGQPMNLGMFVDNELPWGAGKSNDIRRRHELPIRVLEAPSTQPAKAFFVDWLARQYQSIDRLNEAWLTRYGSFNALLQSRSFELPKKRISRLERDFSSFESIYATVYYTTVKKVLKEFGYKGLYLGSRFLSEDYTPEALAACKKYADVVSINIYNASPDERNADLKNQNFPVLISEFSFSSLENGRLGLPHFQTLTESDRNDAYNRFMRTCKEWNNLVGVHWYRWEDFAPSGRMGDNENYSMGLVSITDKPYDSLVAAATAANKMLVERLANAP